MDSKHLSREIFRIALPAITGFLGILFFEIIDIFWVSKLGTDVVAGVAAAGFLEWVVFSLMALASTGCTALISQSLGEKRKDKAFKVAKESIHLALILSVLFLILLNSGVITFLTWMGLEGVALDAGRDYFRVYAWGIGIYFIHFMMGQIFNAHGDTKASVLTLTATLIMNAILDPFFILGWSFFPAWGAMGAAVASCISCIFGATLRFYVLRKKRYIDSLGSHFTWSTDFIPKILRLGVPTAITHVIWSLVYPLLSSVITRFGMVPLAGLTIAHRIEGMAYFSAYGFSIAMTALVGRAIGQKDLKLAKAIAYRGRRLITFLLLPVSLAFIFIPEVLIDIASDDPEVIRQGAKYLFTIGWLEIFLGWEMVFEGSFNGLGNTRRYMFVSVPLTLGRYPAALILVNTFGFGVETIWWVIAISTALKGIFMSLMFRNAKPIITAHTEEPDPEEVYGRGTPTA